MARKYNAIHMTIFSRNQMDFFLKYNGDYMCNVEGGYMDETFFPQFNCVFVLDNISIVFYEFVF